LSISISFHERFLNKNKEKRTVISRQQLCKSKIGSVLILPILGVIL